MSVAPSWCFLWCSVSPKSTSSRARRVIICRVGFCSVNPKHDLRKFWVRKKQKKTSLRMLKYAWFEWYFSAPLYFWSQYVGDNLRSTAFVPPADSEQFSQVLGVRSYFPKSKMQWYDTVNGNSGAIATLTKRFEEQCSFSAWFRKLLHVLRSAAGSAQSKCAAFRSKSDWPSSLLEKAMLHGRTSPIQHSHLNL